MTRKVLKHIPVDPRQSTSSKEPGANWFGRCLEPLGFPPSDIVGTDALGIGCVKVYPCAKLTWTLKTTWTL